MDKWNYFCSKTALPIMETWWDIHADYTREKHELHNITNFMEGSDKVTALPGRARTEAVIENGMQEDYKTGWTRGLM